MAGFFGDGSPWDFEPRSVPLSVTLRASFHSSLGNVSFSVPALDANGTLTGSNVTLGPLESLQRIQELSQGGEDEGLVTVRGQIELGTLSVTPELLESLRQCTLPIQVTRPGEEDEVLEVPSDARLHLAPLLLGSASDSPLPTFASSASRTPSNNNDAAAEGGAGALYRTSSKTEGSDDASIAGSFAGAQWTPPQWTPPQCPRSVTAVCAESIGLAGLEDVEVSVTTEIPILDDAMKARLLPLCFTLDSLSGLPNEAFLHDRCEDIRLHVYPELSRITADLEPKLPATWTTARQHNSTIRFSEPIVWFLGMTSPHVVREWLMHEGVVVEVHDRDKRDAKVDKGDAPAPAEGGEEAEVASNPQENEQEAKKEEDLKTLLDRYGGHSAAAKRQEHPHGVAFFSLSPLLQSRSLQLRLRSLVRPGRSDKKQRLAAARKKDLAAEGLLETEEGMAAVAFRSGLDKREDTANYHLKGTSLSIRAALAAAIPEAKEIEERDQAAKRKIWQTAEVRVGGEASEGHIFTTGSDHEDRSPPGFRVKLPGRNGQEVVGPWRDSAALAEEDEKKLMAALADPNLDKLEEVLQELGQDSNAARGLDLQFERFGRVVLVVEESELDVIKSVLDHVLNWNASVKGMDPTKNEVKTYQLTDQEKVDPNLDVLSGFAVLDGKCRIFVLEGLRRRGLQGLVDIINRDSRPNSSKFKMLHHPDVGFGHRLYADFGTLPLKQIKIRMSIEKLAGQFDLYSMPGGVAVDTVEAAEAIKLLMELKQLRRLRHLRKGSAFPKVLHLTSLQILFGGLLSDAELEGRAPDSSERGMGASAPRKSLARARSSQSVAGDAFGVSFDKTNALPTPTSRPRRKAETDHLNKDFEESRRLRASASAPDFKATNRKAVHAISEENARAAEAAGRRKERDVSFLEGQEIHLYSSQRLNCCELQKAHMRSYMDKEQKTTMWAYGDEYLSQSFEFTGAAPPGKPQLQPCKPSDTYAVPPGDPRPPWRGHPVRPKEDYRIPPRDVGEARKDELTEPWVENEWHGMALAEERHKPIAARVRFEPDKIPHHCRTTERPFDRSQMQPGPRDFGPQAMWESVHYHGRAPREDVYAEAERHNVREREQANAKIRAGKQMKTWDKHQTRHCISDTDRYETVLKDAPAKRYRGRLDGPRPVGIRHIEEYHESGNPMNEWHARLRENDTTPPFNVATGAHLPRDPEVGTGLKRSLTSGNLTKAPWRHNATAFEPGSTYVSTKDFSNSCKALTAASKHNESHVWKNASRTDIKLHERSKEPYLRPADYGVAHLLT